MDNDLISASHVVKILSSLAFSDDEIGMGNQAAINAVIKIIGREPFIDAEPVRHGEWIFAESDGCLSYVRSFLLSSRAYQINTLMENIK